jgi:hypothetical protein
MTDIINHDQRVMITWRELKALGWPLCRTHTRRKEENKIEVSDGKGGTKVIDNPDPFPKARKLGWHPNSPLVWVLSEVLDYFARHGIPVKQ